MCLGFHAHVTRTTSLRPFSETGMDSETKIKGHMASRTSQYGDRFLHSVFDEISATTPSRLYASIPLSTDLASGFQDVTFGYVAHCVDVFANSVKKDIGCSDKEETIAYLGLPDLRNVVVFLAAVKCGYKVRYICTVCCSFFDRSSFCYCPREISHQRTYHF